MFYCLERHTNEAKGQYNAELTLSPRLHVKLLITAIRAIIKILLLLRMSAYAYAYALVKTSLYESNQLFYGIQH